ncbi:MAG: TlpA family protein disulfide reductase [Rhodocyclales bacterium]|nr:TlpA family protein disulfide reductase [Rhodocyclales bacterium]
MDKPNSHTARAWRGRAARLGAIVWLLAAGAAAAAEATVATPLFDSSLHDTEDRPAALAAWRGKPLVVNFWARWCMPCRKEIPELIRARARFKARGVEVLGIGLEDDAAAVREFARTLAINYPLLLAKNQGIALMQALGNAQAGLPFTLAVDRRGNVVYRKLGMVTAADTEAAFAAALRP